jgi:hypothetical protein
MINCGLSALYYNPRDDDAHLSGLQPDPDPLKDYKTWLAYDLILGPISVVHKAIKFNLYNYNFSNIIYYRIIAVWIGQQT